MAEKILEAINEIERLIIKKLFLLFLFLLYSSPCWAALADCEKATIDAAIADTTTYPNGSTITIPSGTCSWSAAVTIDRSLTLLGQTTTSRNATTYEVTPTDSTIIQKNGFSVTATTGVRISGITFDGNVSGASRQPIILPTSPVGMRIDHNHFSYYAATWNKGGGGGYLNVLLDHNRITQPSEESLYIVGKGNLSWADGGICGTDHPERVTFLEDNEWVLTNSNIGNLIDMGEGARVVIRGNRLSGTANYAVQDFVEAHGHCWGQRDGTDNASMYCLEISDNKLYKGNAGYNDAKILRTRGGKNYVFNNYIYDQNWSTWVIQYWIQEVAESACNSTPCAVQSHEDTALHSVPLSGATNYTDGLCTTYPCPMQPNNSYSWGNVWGSGTIAAAPYPTSGGQAEFMAEGRDYWDDIGAGTTFTKDVSGNRNLSVCTIQDVFFETDTNILYRCSATNTWSQVYTPYTYPHPLRGEGAPYTYGSGKRTGGGASGGVVK